jgi:translation elongation factor EF-4
MRENSVTDQLVILLNGESQLQYDRNKPLVGQQREFLDKMDVELQRGISINHQNIEHPDLQQRAQFVALNLIQAIQNSDEQKAAAMCAYLAIFLPDLKQVKAEQQAEGVIVDLVFDEKYVNEVKVQLTPPAGKLN